MPTPQEASGSTSRQNQLQHSQRSLSGQIRPLNQVPVPLVTASRVYDLPPSRRSMGQSSRRAKEKATGPIRTAARTVRPHPPARPTVFRDIAPRPHVARTSASQLAVPINSAAQSDRPHSPARPMVFREIAPRPQLSSSSSPLPTIPPPSAAQSRRRTDNPFNRLTDGSNMILSSRAMSDKEPSRKGCQGYSELQPPVQQYFGRMDVQCPFCGALHWQFEKLTTSTAAVMKFGPCCNSGKITLSNVVDPPAALQALFRAEGPNGSDFFKQIPSRNSVSEH